MKCSAEAALNYCWFRSPNGTVYSVSEVGNNPSHLTYVGSGLRLGECGAMIKKAEDTHMGEWSCHMGIINGTEAESSVSVIVTGSYTDFFRYFLINIIPNIIRNMKIRDFRENEMPC